MKLKNVLMLAFIALTVLPITIIALLLYRSGFELSQASYTRNLTESITVQEDYIAQTIENNMIADFRFAVRIRPFLVAKEAGQTVDQTTLLNAYQSYLEGSEDKITICSLLDKNNTPIYSIGEKAVVDTVLQHLPVLNAIQDQSIHEFELDPDSYSLGIITPIRDANNVYLGSFISIYSKHYIFKIISSYYNIADTATYLCRSNGNIINFRRLKNERQSSAMEQALHKISLNAASPIHINVSGVPVVGYQKKISNTPWHLVGFINENQVYTFANQFIWAYFIIIFGVWLVSIVLAYYFSKRVVQPINSLIEVMDGYQNGMPQPHAAPHEEIRYFEIQYLHIKFTDLMKTIMLVQHNFEGIFKLYQSGNMSDTNIDIDVINQTITSNKQVLQELMNKLDLPAEACIVERFTHCFCPKDQVLLLSMFERMRDEHLSVENEADVYTPYLNQKWFHTLVVPLYVDDRLSRLFIQLRDVTSFKKQEIESTEQARKDPLTDIYNRNGFTERVNNILDENDRTAQHGLLFIDMDYFKLVNDNLGHNTGDTLLCSVAKTLRDTTGPNGVPSRFGGDEFAIFLPNASMQDIENLRQELSNRLIYPFKTDKFSFVVSASIGSAIWNSDAGGTLEDLLQRADDDMYKAKKRLKQSAQRI